MKYKTLSDLPDVNGKTVLLRADLNVPAKGHEVTDMTRIDRLKPTIDDLVHKGANVRILSHFGRPKGVENLDFSLSFLAPILSNAWGHEVSFKDGNSQVTLLENTRFNSGEESNSMELAETWAEGADFYINDAFSVSHRAHASTEAIARILPSYAGHLMTKELSALERALESPETPVTALVGGAKISTKLTLLKNLIKKVDYLVLGGGMANTFIRAQGHDVGSSLCEDDMIDIAKDILAESVKENCEIILPDDFVVAGKFEANADNETVSITEVPADKMALDIGAQSITKIKGVIDNSKTIVWNGPMGAFEIEPFDIATVELAKYVGQKTQSGNVISVAGGGDTVSALVPAGVVNELTYLSSAGGAFLEWLEGKELPGVKALCS